MPQGALKKAKASTSSSSKRPSALGPKKGLRTIAPKKAVLIKQKKMIKKLSAGLVAKTERNLAEKAGHLEILAGGKKDKKGEKGKDKKRN